MGPFPLPVSQIVGLRIAQIARNGQLQKAHAWNILYNPKRGKPYTHMLFSDIRMYTATHGRVYNIPTVGIYVVDMSSAIL